MQIRKKSGFTLIELIVVILIIGILAALALPQYLKSMETSKADDALSTVQMIATTNRMYNLDRGIPTAGQFTDGCSTVCSNSAPPATSGPSCDLMACGYLARQQWDNKPYDFFACDGSGNPGSAPCCSQNAPLPIACTQRKVKSAANPQGSANAKYQGWGYTVDITGTVKTLPSSSTPVPQG